MKDYYYRFFYFVAIKLKAIVNHTNHNGGRIIILRKTN